MSDVYNKQFLDTKLGSTMDQTHKQGKGRGDFQKQLKTGSGEFVSKESSPAKRTIEPEISPEDNDSDRLMTQESPDLRRKSLGTVPPSPMDNSMVTQPSPENVRFQTSKIDQLISPKTLNNDDRNQIRQLDLFPNKNQSFDQTVNSGSVNEIMHFNKELQQALVEMKKDNDQLRKGLQFVISGGSPDKAAQFFQKREDESNENQEHEMDSQQEDHKKKAAQNQNDFLFGDHVDESGYVNYEEGPNGSPQRVKSLQLVNQQMTFNKNSQESLPNNIHGATLMSAPDFNSRSGELSMSGQSQKTEKVQHYPKEQIMNFAKEVNANDDHLYAGDKKQLKKFKIKLKDFKKALPDSSETKAIIKNQRQIHRQLDGDKKNGEQSDSDVESVKISLQHYNVSESSISKREREDNYIKSSKKSPTKYHNPFIQNICENVNKAFKYKPGEENAPIYNFNSMYTSPKKAVKMDKIAMARRGSIGRQSVMEKSNNQLGESPTNEQFQTFETDNKRRNSVGAVRFEQFDDSPNPFSLNSTKKGIMRKEWLDPPRPVEDPNAGKEWVTKRKRGFVVETDYDFTAVNEKKVDKFQMGVKTGVEDKATYTYLDRQEGNAKQTFHTMNDVVKNYSNYDFEKREAVKANVENLRAAANEMTKWAVCGSTPGSKSHTRHPMVELYGAFAIDLGINNEMDTELNMSPEGLLRRKGLQDKIEADKYFEDFTKKYKGIGKEKPLNLTLKRMD